MLIKSDFEVAQPLATVWHYFDDIAAVAGCLPGAELTEDLGDDRYKGRVAVRMGPVGCASAERPILPSVTK